MPKTADGQYEMVLENRQVLIIFFAIVVLCGVFFGLGYVVGKNTMGYIPPAEPNVVAAAGKKSAIGAEAASEEAPPAQPAPDLTFHKALEEKASAAKLEGQPPPGAPTPGVKSAADSTAAAPSGPKLVTASAPSASVASPPKSVSAPAQGSISLQVAALSKKEDADALLSLLKSKSFPATLVTYPNDRLYRVQIGPFASLKEAEETKARLEQEGFKAITKK